MKGVSLNLIATALGAAWVTNIVACCIQGEWSNLLVGVLVPPIGIIHGIGVWFT